jgi:hypothetical protein
MKTIFKIAAALTIVVTLLVVGAQGVLADTGTSTTNASATHAAVSEVKGVITAIDKTVSPPSVTITPKDGSAVVLKVAATTIITKTRVGKITIDDLAANDQVTATYNKATNVAGRINIIQPPEKRRAFEGTIKSIVAPVIVVTTNKGDETFQVSSKTQYQVPGVKDATLDNFKVGDKVSVLTIEANTTASAAVQTAQRLTLIPTKPIKTIHAGTVTAYTANASITIQDLKGASVTFLIDNSTKINLRKGTSAIALGDKVIVTDQREPSESQFTAKIILDTCAKEVKNTLTSKAPQDFKTSIKTEKGKPFGQVKSNANNSVQNSKNQ